MSDDFIDPPPSAEPGEGNLRGDDLINKVCVFLPRAVGQWPAKPAEGDQKAMKASDYVECEVWVIGVGGIETHGDSVRLAWWRSVPGLRDNIGRFIEGKVRVNEDRSRTIERLSDADKKAVRALKDEILAQSAATTATLEVTPEHSDEPF